MSSYSQSLFSARGGYSDFRVCDFLFFSAALVRSDLGLTRALQDRAMDATESEASVVIKVHKIVDETSSDNSPSHSDRSQRHCIANEDPEQSPLTASPSILLHVLSSYQLEPKDLAALEATCKFFRNPANFPPDAALPLPELAALDACGQKAMFRTIKQEEKEKLKQRCGGSWKLVLGYLSVGERNYRREKPQVIAGPGHSIVVTTKGEVYSFGANRWGQLGLGNTEDQFKPCLIRSLQGIRIVQAAVGEGRTMLVSDTGSVYKFGHNSFGGLEFVKPTDAKCTVSPKLVESLKGVFVVQASIGNYFSAVLSREGQVYTFSWGRDQRLGHMSDVSDVAPRLLSGPLEDALAVQIAAGNCYLLILAYRPNGMSVYSLGCGQGGKLAHGCRRNEGIPKLIEHFQAPGNELLSISAGPFHAAALGCDGSVFTWGWGHYGCLGHGDEAYRTAPMAVGGGALGSVKAVHVSAGRYNTFVVADNGDVYSFGWGSSWNLGFQADTAENVHVPKLATLLAGLGEKVVQISATKDCAKDDLHAHTIALTESGKVYVVGAGAKGQLGVRLAEGQDAMPTPARLAIDLVV